MNITAQDSHYHEIREAVMDLMLTTQNDWRLYKKGDPKTVSDFQSNPFAKNDITPELLLRALDSDEDGVLEQSDVARDYLEYPKQQREFQVNLGTLWQNRSDLYKLDALLEKSGLDLDALLIRDVAPEISCNDLNTDSVLANLQNQGVVSTLDPELTRWNTGTQSDVLKSALLFSSAFVDKKSIAGVWMKNSDFMGFVERVEDLDQKFERAAKNWREQAVHNRACSEDPNADLCQPDPC